MMKKNLIPVVFFVVVGTLGGGCYYDVESELYDMSCDTTNVSYGTTINTIMNSYGCLSCHSGSSPSGNIGLETHSKVKTMADNGKLVGSITHASGFIPMPDGAAKMSQCDINRVKVWVSAGAPNN